MLMYPRMHFSLVYKNVRKFHGLGALWRRLQVAFPGFRSPLTHRPERPHREADWLESPLSVGTLGQKPRMTKHIRVPGMPGTGTTSDTLLVLK